MMEFLQNILDNSQLPVATAFVLGLLTAVSPCPLATNIAAVGYIGKDIESRHRIFVNGLLYTLGRVLAYSLLGAILIAVIKEGASTFHIQKFISKWGEAIMPWALLIIGVLMLFADRLNLPKFGINPEKGAAKKGAWGAMLLGLLFALAFCPTSGIFYFGMLIPMSAAATAGYLLPIVFAVATGLPVIIVAWLLAFSISGIGGFYNKMRVFQKWLNYVVASTFIIVGIYYLLMNFHVI